MFHRTLFTIFWLGLGLFIKNVCLFNKSKLKEKVGKYLKIGPNKNVYEKLVRKVFEKQDSWEVGEGQKLRKFRKN